MESSKNREIATLRDRIATIESNGRRAHGVLPFGIDPLDRKVPGGGLALGALHEVAGGYTDCSIMGEGVLSQKWDMSRLPGLIQKKLQSSRNKRRGPLAEKSSWVGIPTLAFLRDLYPSSVRPQVAGRPDIHPRRPFDQPGQRCAGGLFGLLLAAP